MRIKVEEKGILNHCEFCGYEKHEPPLMLKGGMIGIEDKNYFAIVCPECGKSTNDGAYRDLYEPLVVKGQSFKFNGGLITEISEDESTPPETVVDKCGKSTNSETQGG